MAAECVVDELLELRTRINETAAAAFGDVPEANVTWSDEGLIARENVDISIAVATDGGLVTPVRLKQHELEGGVFSVSNRDHQPAAVRHPRGRRRPPAASRGRRRGAGGDGDALHAFC
jgi:2-oxoacid dehydrogenase/acyltransferase catalytic subunit